MKQSALYDMISFLMKNLETRVIIKIYPGFELMRSWDNTYAQDCTGVVWGARVLNK